MTDNAWRELRDQISRQFTVLDGGTPGLQLLASEHSEARLSVDGSDDHISLPCELEPTDRIQVLEGMTTQVVSAGNESRFWIETPSELRENFIPFITDVLLLSETQGMPVAFDATLENWKELWKGKRGRLDRSQQRGLLGELVTLRHLAAHSSSTISRWVGPLRELHDFMADRLHIEVKTTTRQPPSVRISPIGQAAPLHGLAELALVVIGLEDGDEVTLVQAIEELRAVIKDARERTHFEKVLMRSGYRDEHAQHYRTGYSVAFEEVHWITAESPVLDPQKLGQIPSTVRDIGYTLEVYAMEMKPISKDVWKRMANSLD